MTGQCPESCEQTGQCGIQIVVEADGSVFPCDFYVMDPYYLGNFNKDRIQVINNRRKEIGFIERSRKLSRECRECKFILFAEGDVRETGTFTKKIRDIKIIFVKAIRHFLSIAWKELRKLPMSCKTFFKRSPCPGDRMKRAGGMTAIRFRRFLL